MARTALSKVVSLYEQEAVLPSVIIRCAYGCSHIGVSTTYKRAVPRMVCSARVNRELQRRARSNGYSVMVSAEEHGLVNELVPHHRVVSGVVRDAQSNISVSAALKRTVLAREHRFIVNLHLLTIEALVQSKYQIDVLFTATRERHRLARARVCQSPERVVAPQRLLQTTQVQPRVRVADRVRSFISLVHDLVKRLIQGARVERHRNGACSVLRRKHQRSFGHVQKLFEP